MSMQAFHLHLTTPSAPHGYWAGLRGLAQASRLQLLKSTLGWYWWG